MSLRHRLVPGGRRLASADQLSDAIAKDMLTVTPISAPSLFGELAEMLRYARIALISGDGSRESVW